MNSRRGFLASILAVASAPAIVSASRIMRVTPVMEAGTLTYKASGRYDINFDKWWIEETDTTWMRPNKIIVPSAMLAEARRLIDAEFDKAYGGWHGQR
jgi:hypothetical protein